ncbi:MAG: DNA mismatch repair protein MutS [Flavobacteriaceae bacterium]|nr:DNA mismatch repair protein MutS [Flavobacteriaceae bacterium]
MNGHLTRYRINMIFPNNYEEKCGFNVIREMLIDRCLSPFGVERVNRLTVQYDYQVINNQLNQVREFVQLLNAERSFPLDNYTDTRTIVSQVMTDHGLWCITEEFIAIKHTLLNAEKLYHIITSQVHQVYSYPTVALVGQGVVLLSDLLERIDQVIDKNGQVRDSASKVLAAIRKEKVQVANTIQKKFDTIWRKAQAAGLTDNEMAASVRDGRMVIPVTASFKRRFKGVIHDESRSGKTVFIEPEELVQENTRLFVLEQDERREVVRVLMEMTTSIREHYIALNKIYDFIGTVDLLRAKALLAQKIGAVKPVVECKQQISWKNAYHPILQISLKTQDKALNPLQITLEWDNRILVVSGANSGGKSVTLKTVALLQYMLQCGLLIPVSEDSKAGIFEHIFMDIGDGQSIENNLSTYTAHLNHMKLFLEHTHAQTLILIDEFGGGTEPELGGAIAESILEQLNNRGCFGIITTHFYNLKGFAQRTKGLQNGAMLYDFKDMKPLYQLSQGHPGSSYALDVARRIGVSEEILINASQKIDADYLLIEQELQEVVAAKVAELKQKKELIVTIEEPVERAQKVIEPIVEKSVLELVTPMELKVGDYVKREGKGKTGTILEIRGKKATVLIESMKFTFALEELVYSHE